ncbi:MAG TPA: hypothetical protein DCR93_04200 [Cytophagales bacterium]|nr:hypothetical protein [Cytophagales bacterium]HAP58730.1 hypothetical protein [Cytophagales bacterium]
MFLLGSCLLVGHMGYAQTRGEFEETTMTERRARPDKNPFRQRNLLPIYKTKTKNTLSGNRCFEEATRKMGFEYVVMPEGEAFSLSPVDRALSNAWVRFALIFRAGPWWPITVAIKRKQCRKRMGDYVG